MGFAEQLRQERERRRIGRAELADKLGIIPQTMFRLETGRERIDSDLLVRWAAALDLDVVIASRTALPNLEGA